jgi:hypothetical protein
MDGSFVECWWGKVVIKQTWNPQCSGAVELPETSDIDDFKKAIFVAMQSRLATTTSIYMELVVSSMPRKCNGQTNQLPLS